MSIRVILSMILITLLKGYFIVCGQTEGSPYQIGKDGILVYAYDTSENRIPDFSYCGYKAGEYEIPFVPARVFIPQTNEDATQVIQAAIDHVASLSTGEDGFKGAILLDKGVYKVSGRLVIKSSGIVLRGSGTGKNGTTLFADGLSRETLIKIYGDNKREVEFPETIQDDYVPVNAQTVQVADDHKLKVNDNIIILRPSTKEWIDLLGMKEFGGETGYIGWRPGTRNVYWDVQITEITGGKITFDSPLTTALDKNFGGGKVARYTWEGRIENIGIENLNLESDFDRSNQKDENHCWMAITLENAKDAWVRQVNFKHFAGSAVAVYETTKRVTIEDCISREPISEIGGQRRYTFFISGQQNLVQRCYAENGYHDFAVGFCAAGPNAFVQCESRLPHSFSGTIDSWASGVLFDNVTVDGHALCLKNRMQDAQGAGWSAANSVLWHCSASRIECFKPPLAQNWAIGTWASFSGDALWYESNSHIKPLHLYYTQLSERVGDDVLSRAHMLPISYKASTSPTISEAKEFTEISENGFIQLEKWIRDASLRQPISTDIGIAKTFDQIDFIESEKIVKQDPIRIENGWLVNSKGILTGQLMGVQWWRGNARHFAAAASNPHITRFVPGRTGHGYTDDLEVVASRMTQNHVIGIEHNYGLWYDRRRDDHVRIRRINGEVWPPFYELPFSRSGEGTAWDGLSKYDLTKYNPWYWNRLREYAEQADQKGLILLHHNYFQHNILEAGAHWADFPWRTANNINQTGFPEPPPYVGDKRIFMDKQFYDISNPLRRDLHKSYIRKCLDNFSENQNVIQLISKEYTGPLHFAEFWLDVIIEWEEETGKSALVGLSTTKDVQDALLKDKSRSDAVDIIDIRYWQYRSDGSLYAPQGGQHLAPRQHARQVKPGKVSFESVYRAVKEYKEEYPEKAIMYSGSLTDNMNWAVFMAGGSLANIPSLDNSEILAETSGMMPLEGGRKSNLYILSNKIDYLIFSQDKKVMNLDFIKDRHSYQFTWIDPANGKTLKVETGAIESEMEKPVDGPLVLWIKKKKIN